MTESFFAVIGSDPTIVNEAVLSLTTELLGDIDPSMALEDYVIKASTPDEEESENIASKVIEALNTPPFLVPLRVIVLRDAQLVTSADVDRLVTWSDSPTPGIFFVVSVVGGKSNSRIVSAAHKVINVSVGSKPKDHLEFVAKTLDNQKVHTSSGVAQKIANRVGDDVARVNSLARTLSSIYGTRVLTFDDVEPYLGDAGNVPEWDLTDAIDEARTAAAIATARRMLDSGARVGVQVINILQRHYLKMARLDGSGANTAQQAASILGGHSFPAEKLLRTSRLLGSDRIAHAVSLVARADRDMKGGMDYGSRNDQDADLTVMTIIEVLVARLSKLSEAARRS